MYIIINAVDEIPSGSYFLHREERALELLREGSFRQASGYLTLEQSLGRDASAVVFFMSDLNRVLERFGNRGYRAVQIESGIIGGKLYLGAYTLNLGATGLTFYDDDVTEFFSPHAKGKSAIFVVALGVPARKVED
jgi:SagB-type dehydrogenase family enzyme